MGFFVGATTDRKGAAAYAAMRTEDAGKYNELKTVILRQCDINEETYRQRFRSAKLEKGETLRELAT